MNVLKKVFLLVSLGLFFSPGVWAQITVRGQIFLPDGSPPVNPVRVDFTSDDGTVHDYRFTDSNGRFILERLTAPSYTITVSGDGINYDDTVYSLRPEVNSTPRIILNPPPRKRVAPGAPEAAANAYRPNPKAHELYGRAMKAVDNKQYSAAEPLLRQTTEADPLYAMAWNALGAVKMQEKEYAEAEKPLRKALEIDPRFITALLNLGTTLNHLGKYQDAIAPLREALRLQPDTPAAHEHLGIALVETEQFPEAEQELRKAQNVPETEQLMVLLYLGKLYARTGEYQKSIDAFNAFLEKAPNAGNAADVRRLIERMKKELAARP